MSTHKPELTKLTKLWKKLWEDKSLNYWPLLTKTKLLEMKLLTTENILKQKLKTLKPTWYGMLKEDKPSKKKESPWENKDVMETWCSSKPWKNTMKPYRLSDGWEKTLWELLLKDKVENSLIYPKSKIQPQNWKLMLTYSTKKLWMNSINWLKTKLKPLTPNHWNGTLMQMIMTELA